MLWFHFPAYFVAGAFFASFVPLSRVGDFEPQNAVHAGAFGLGLAAMSLVMTRSLARLQGTVDAGAE